MPAFPRKRGKGQSEVPHFSFPRLRGKAGMGAAAPQANRAPFGTDRSTVVITTPSSV